MIFGADGAHSRVRAQIFDDREPEKTVIQHLIEIKLDMKEKETKVKHSYNPSSSSSMEKLWNTVDFIEHSVLPTLRRGKLHVWNEGADGTATLHILVAKEIYDTLLTKKNNQGNMGTYGNPYTRLRQVPIENGARSLIAEAVRDTIGIKNIDPESIRITTIPMHVYKAKNLVTVVNDKTYILVGDAAFGLIFIRGVNHGLLTAAMNTGALFDLKMNNSSEKINTFAIRGIVPEELNNNAVKLTKIYESKVNDITSEQKMIDKVLTVIETSSEFSTTSSFRGKSSDEKEAEQDNLPKLYDAEHFVPALVLRYLLQAFDDELNKIQLLKDEEGNDINLINKSYRPWLPSLDLLANQIDADIYAFETNPNNFAEEEERLKNILIATITLVQGVFNTQNKAEQKQFIFDYKATIAQLSKEDNAENSQSYSLIGHAVRSLLSNITQAVSSSGFLNRRPNAEKAACTVVQEGFSTLKLNGI